MKAIETTVQYSTVLDSEWTISKLTDFFLATDLPITLLYMIIFSIFGIGNPESICRLHLPTGEGVLLLIPQSRTARPEAWWRASVERRAARMA